MGIKKQHPTEEQFWHIIEAMPNAVVIVDQAGQIVLVNSKSEILFGYRQGELIGRPLSLLVPERYRRDHAHYRQRFTAAPQAREMGTGRDLYALCKDGTEVPVEIGLSPLLSNGSTLVLAAVVDITERKQTQEALRRSEASFRSLVQKSTDVVTIVDAHGNVIYQSPAVENVFGYTPDEMVGSSSFSYVHPEDRPALLAQLQELLQHPEQTTVSIFRLRHKDGSWCTVEATGRNLLDDPDIGGIVANARDVTEREEALAAQVESEQQLHIRVQQQAAVAHIGQVALREPTLQTLFAEVVAVVAKTLQIPFCKILELLPNGEELLLRTGVGWQEGLVGIVTVGTDLDSQAGYTLVSDQPIIVTDMHTESRFHGPDLLLEHGVVSGMSTIIWGTDGPFGVLGAHTSETRLFTGDDVNFLSAVANVLASAIARQRYQERADYLATIVRATEDAVIGSYLDGAIRSWNAGAEKMYGYKAAEAVGRHISFLSLPEHRQEVQNIVQQLANGRRVEPFETKQARKDGEVIDVSLSLSPITDPEQNIIGAAVIGRNVTALKKAQRELEKTVMRERASYAEAEQARQRLSFLFEAGKALGSSLDYEETLRTVTQLATRHIADWCAVNLLDDNQQLKLVSVAHKDPEKEVWAQQNYEELLPPGAENDGLHKVMRTGVAEFYPYISDEELRRRINSEKQLQIVRQLGLRSMMIVPMVTHEKVVGIITFISSHEDHLFKELDLVMAEELAARAATAVDNAYLYHRTRQLNVELEKRVQERTEQLEAANKELEAFAYSVSHDLRAPLRALDGFSRILVEDYSTEIPTEGQFYLERIRRNAQQMGDLIDDLLNFSRLNRQALKKETVDPARLVHAVLEQLLHERDGRSITIEVKEMPPCYADPRLLSQVFTNLLSNALKYTRERDDARVTSGATLHNGATVYYVRDNGIGFDVKYADHVFAVFQRLNHVEKYEGTGVGLATVQRIIHRHGGKIWAEAEIDKGATFYFTLEPQEAT